MNRSRVDGFSLIELTITIALCALVVTLTVVNVSFFNSGIVRSEVEKLHAACFYLQQCALTSHQKQVLVFDLENNRYSFDGRTEQLQPPVVFGVVPGAQGPPSSPYRTIKSPVTFPGNKIVFHPDGIVSSGTVYLTDQDKKIFYGISSGIAQVSHVRKYRYTDKWMLLS